MFKFYNKNRKQSILNPNKKWILDIKQFQINFIQIKDNLLIIDRNI